MAREGLRCTRSTVSAQGGHQHQQPRGGSWLGKTAAYLVLFPVYMMCYSASSEEPLQCLVSGPQDISCFEAELAQEVVCSSAILSKPWPKTIRWKLWKEPPICSTTELKREPGWLRAWEQFVSRSEAEVLGTAVWIRGLCCLVPPGLGPDLDKLWHQGGLFQWGPFSCGPFNGIVWPMGCCCSSSSCFNFFLCFDSQKGKINSHNNTEFDSIVREWMYFFILWCMISYL